MTPPERKLELGILDVEHPLFTLEFAARAEELGYSRYWLAEHHGQYSRSASPDIMTAMVAGLTNHIRVGPAGILLHFRSPLKVAEDFRLLSLLFPGRIDLGMARGIGGPAVVGALLDGRPRLPTAQEHGERIAEVRRLMEGTLPEDHPLRDTVVAPVGRIEQPQLWVLGTTSESARVAAALGAAFCVAEHLGAPPLEDGAEIARSYRDAFVPSARHETPLWSVCVGGRCAETEEEARVALEGLPGIFRTTWVGPPERCREQIEQLADCYGTSEVIVSDIGRGSLATKRTSYELLARAFRLRGSRGRRKPAAARNPQLP